MKKLIEEHFCSNNDGECVCKCFVEGADKVQNNVEKYFKNVLKLPCPDFRYKNQ